MEGICKCSHHKVVPVSIALIGLTFLLGQLGIFTDAAVAMIWPILLIVIGIFKMKKCNCCPVGQAGKCC
jgi:hypothetical protein